MKTVFFGASEFVIPVLELLKNRFGLSLIVTTEKAGSVVDYAKQNEIPYLSVSNLGKEEIQKLKDEDADLGIVADFGIIIKQDVLDIFPQGFLNIHPSLLPKYRGPTPVQTAILNGDIETGVTIIKIDEKMDHGPILAQEEIEITNENSFEMLKILFAHGANLLEKVLIDYVEEILTPIEQNEEEASYTKMLTKKDGEISIEKVPSKEKLMNMIRAFYPWPGIWFKTTLGNKETIIKLLPENKIQVEGKNPMGLKDFLNGYPDGKQIIKKLSLDA